VEPIFKVGRATYYGDVSAHLANLVIKKLGIKARSEKPGIAGRASIAFQSEVDRIEAEEAGRAAVRAALDGVTGVMVGFERDSTEPYSSHTVLIPIEKVMLEERVMPDNFINVEGNDVTPEFVEWCKPLIGGELRKFVTFK
jgi:6-phosphofructokinase 1